MHELAPAAPRHISRTGVEHSSARARAGGGSSGISTALQVAGRAIFGGYFLYNALNHFQNREMLAAYARTKKVPAPDVAVTASGILLLVGGLSLLAGTKPKLGAGAISAFLLAVSPTMHDFWRVEDPQQRMGEMVNFTKNMALVGGALLAAALPEPWPGSVRA